MPTRMSTNLLSCGGTAFPAKFRDRAPRMERFEEGDAWVGEGVTEPINFGFNASAKLLRADRKPWVRFEDIPLVAMSQRNG